MDPQGTIRGQDAGHGGHNACYTRFVWQKVPAPTMAFDGIYAGVSRTSEVTAGPSGACVPDGPPPRLTIVNGIARTLWGRPAEAEGSVSAQGVLVMQAPNGYRFDGHVDGKGTITGMFTRSGTCSYQMVYLKKDN